MGYTIIRTPTGIKAHALPGNQLEKEVFETFSYAIGSYSHCIRVFQGVTSGLLKYAEAMPLALDMKE